MKTLKIIILGFQTPIGQAILEQLGIHNYPTEQIFLLDPKKVNEKQLYQGEEKHIIPFDAFDWKAPFIVLICDKEVLNIYPKKTLPKNSWAIDCTGLFSKSEPIIPMFNETKIKKIKNRILCSPTSMTVVLSRVLSDLIKYEPVKTRAIALIGTSFLCADEAKKLREQTRSVYTQIPVLIQHNQPPLAFNLIPQIPSEKAKACPQQLKQILNINCDFRHCFVPVFRGFCLFISCTLKQKIKQPKNLWKSNPFVHLMDLNDGPFILSAAATLSETKVFVMDIKYQENNLSFWVVGDDIQTGLTLNTIHIIESLIKKII